MTKALYYVFVLMLIWMCVCVWLRPLWVRGQWLWQRNGTVGPSPFTCCESQVNSSHAVCTGCNLQLTHFGIPHSEITNGAIQTRREGGREGEFLMAGAKTAGQCHRDVKLFL